jgi:hypothetical protein
LSEEIKRKVTGWLKEEGLFFEEVVDPDTYFNFSIKVAGLSMDVVKDITRDVVLARSTMIFNRDQTRTLKTMSDMNREAFFWEVRIRLLANNEVGAFEIKPDLERMQIFVQARGIFRDGLTKDRLLKSILVVHKSLTMVAWLLDHFSGSSEEEINIFYM